MACRVRKYTTKYHLPLNHKNVNKRRYLQETLYRAWEYHLSTHNLQVEDVVFRKITYDAIYDALRNRNGKIHAKGFLKEYENFMKQWNENYSHLNEKIADWENYRKSTNYAEFLATVRQINRLDRRISITTDNALAYMYSKWQKGYTIGEKFIELEKKLKLDLIPKAWSKNWLWLATTILVFDANNLYASTLGRSKTTISEWDEEMQEAIKVHTTRWYERKDLELSEFEKTLFRVYENIIVPISGELGSVAVAEIARRGTCHALLHIARALTSVARFHPTLRLLSWGATLIDALRYILDNSILAWLGWQIAIEWQADGTIQAFMQEAAKYIYAGLTGAQVWKARQHADWGLFDLAMYYTVLKYQNGKLEADQEDIVNFIKEHGSEKQKEIIARIEKAFSLAQRLYALKQHWKATFEYYREKIQDYTYDIVIRGETQRLVFLQNAADRLFKEGIETGEKLFLGWLSGAKDGEKVINKAEEAKRQTRITGKSQEIWFLREAFRCPNEEYWESWWSLYYFDSGTNFKAEAFSDWDEEGRTLIIFVANDNGKIQLNVQEEGDKDILSKIIPSLEQLGTELDRFFANIKAFGSKEKIFRYAIDTTYPELRRLWLKISSGERECVSVVNFKQLVKQHMNLSYWTGGEVYYRKKVELVGGYFLRYYEYSGVPLVESAARDLMMAIAPEGVVGTEIEIRLSPSPTAFCTLIFRQRNKIKKVECRPICHVYDLRNCTLTFSGKYCCVGEEWTDWKEKKWDIYIEIPSKTLYIRRKRSKILCLTVT